MVHPNPHKERRYSDIIDYRQDHILMLERISRTLMHIHHNIEKLVDVHTPETADAKDDSNPF